MVHRIGTTWLWLSCLWGCSTNNSQALVTPGDETIWLGDSLPYVSSLPARCETRVAMNGNQIASAVNYGKTMRQRWTALPQPNWTAQRPCNWKDIPIALAPRLTIRNWGLDGLKQQLFTYKPTVSRATGSLKVQRANRNQLHPILIPPGEPPIDVSKSTP